MPFVPRYYQTEAIESAIAYFKSGDPAHTLEILPTGSGKSVVIANIGKELDGKTIVLQPSKEILEQNYAKFKSYGYRAGIYSASAGSKRVENMTFATIGSVATKKHLFKEFSNIIIDECHLVNPKEGLYKDFIHTLSDAKVLGLTATPYRLTSTFEGSVLEWITTSSPAIFSKVLYYIQNKVLFDEGHLAPLAYYDIDAIDRTQLQLNKKGDDFTAESIRYLYRKIAFDKLTAKWANILLAKRKNCLVFCSLVEEAYKVQKLIPGSVVLTGDTETSVRTAILNEFKAGNIRCLLNVGVLTTGFDFPALESILMAFSTMSLSKFYQVVGRVMRPFTYSNGEKKTGWVVDLGGNIKKFGKIETMEIGYYDEWRELNSADFGAYTSRNRLFGCFAKHGLPIVWPEPTHSKKPKHGMFEGLKKWMPVKDVLDFADEGESIFNRKKPLSDKTLERIYAGLVKYVAKGDTSFISKYYSGRPAGKVSSVNDPAGTITTFNQTLVQGICLLKYNSTDKTGKHYPPSVDDPSPVVTTQNRLGVVNGEFLQHYYGNGYTSGMEEPCPTLTTKERCALVQPEYFIDKHYGTAQNQSVDQPAGTILPTDKHRLIQCDPFIMDTQFNNGPKSIEYPAGVITANRKHHYIVNPSHGGHSTSTDAPCPVIIARQDKAPLYLVQAEGGSVAIAVFDCDSEVMIKIKQFMSVYGLVDIKMRMLRVPELLRIQGFDANYQMVGNQSDHKKFIGNSVHPLVPKKWAEAMGLKLIEQYKKKVA